MSSPALAVPCRGHDEDRGPCCLVGIGLLLHLQAQFRTYTTGKGRTNVLFRVVQANVAQLVEQLICNQPVGGSSPFIGSNEPINGEIPKWPTGADCKSAASQLRRFESCSPHHSFGDGYCRFQAMPANAGRGPRPATCGSSSVGRASAFQAERRGFESRLPLHHYRNPNTQGTGVFQ